MKHFSQNTVVGLVAAVQFLPGALSLEATVQVTVKPAPYGAGLHICQHLAGLLGGCCPMLPVSPVDSPLSPDPEDHGQPAV